MHDKRIGIFHVVIVFVLAGLAYASAHAAGRDDGLLHVYFLDVGQGDAIFIESPNHTQVLIDGGPDGRVLDRLAEVLPPLDQTLDAVVATHPHADHIGGLVQVLARYKVDAIVEAHERYDSALYRTWERAVQTEATRRVEALAGTTLDLGDGVVLTVLYPFSSGDKITVDEPHDFNVTTLLTHGDTSILLTGDMESDAEQVLVDRGMPLDVDVLKIGHHGSRTSSSIAFLKATTPYAAIISLGKNNRYRHPAPSTLARLEQMQIPYYRTDTAGTVELVSDGQSFFIQSEK